MAQLEQAAAYAQQYQQQANSQAYSNSETNETSRSNDDVIDADFTDKN
jgi:hypothetical protein